MTDKAHDSRAVANCLLEKAQAAGQYTTPMQILKLVYLSHGWMLGLCKRPLITHEVQAWQYGPVIPELYAAVRKYRSSPITETLPRYLDGSFDSDEKHIMNEVFRVYGSFTGPQLSTLTHKTGTPWSQAWAKGAFSIIPDDAIQAHFEQLTQ